MGIAYVLTIFVIGTIPIIYAAVQPWVWSLYGVCMIAAFLFFLWQERIEIQLSLGLGIKLTVIIFFAATLFHSLPLPGYLLSYFNPDGFETFTKAKILLDSQSSWKTLSYSPQVAFSWWAFLISLYLFYTSLVGLCANANKLKRIVCFMIGIGLIEAFYGLIQALVPTLAVLWADHVQAYMGDARGTFINRNHFAGFIEMVWPLALGFTLAQGGWGNRYTLKKILESERLNRQALLALGIVVLLLALLFSRSRAGILSASVGFLTFILLAHTGNRGMSRYSWLMLVGIIGMLVIYSMAIGVGPVADRFLRLGEGESRLDFWRDSLAIVKDHPLGIGLRNFEKVFPVYNVSSLIDNKMVDHAHNDYLQILVEAGWVGFAAVMSGFLIFMWKSVRRIRHMNSRTDPMRFFLAVGAFSGLVSLSFHSFFDFNLQIPANCVYFVTLIAILHACCVHRNHNAELEARNSKLRD